MWAPVQRLVVGVAISLGLIGCSSPSTSSTSVVSPLPSAVASAQVTGACPVTLANGSTPPGVPPSVSGVNHGNGAVWVDVYPGGKVVAQPDQVDRDGSVDMKFPWWRGSVGQLVVTGRRLDGPSPPLRAYIPSGYGSSGFQATGLIFPTEGSWEVIGRVGKHTLTFVTLVEKSPPA